MFANMIISPQQIDLKKKWYEDPNIILWIEKWLENELCKGKIPSFLCSNWGGGRDGERAWDVLASGGNCYRACYAEIRNLTTQWVTNRVSRQYWRCKDITILAWLKADSDISSTNIVITHGGHGETDNVNVSYQLRVSATNNLEMFWEYGSGSNVIANAGDNTFLADGSYHLYSARRINGSTCSVKFYRDTQFITEISGLTLPSGGWDGWLTIGNDAFSSEPSNSNTLYFHGCIGQIVIYAGDLPLYEEQLYYQLTKNIYA